MIPHEIQLAAIRKTITAAIRLKHSLNADAEIKTRGVELYDRFSKALLAGKPMELLASEIMDVGQQ